MRINLYNSGSSVSGQLGHGNAYPTLDVKGGMYYADHLVDRRVTLPFIFDGSTRERQAVIAEYPTAFAGGGSIATHYLYEGTRILDIVMHNKKALEGVTLEIKLRYADDDTIVGPTLTADLANVGYINIGAMPNLILTRDAYVDMAITDTAAAIIVTAVSITATAVGTPPVKNTLSAACFAAFVDLAYYNDHHGCGCAVESCETTFPEPDCMPGM